MIVCVQASMVHLYVCIGAVFLAPLAAGFVEKDLVNSLYPGWPEKDLPCRIFSGYMDAVCMFASYNRSMPV